jgi:hypothetical protein
MQMHEACDAEAGTATRATVVVYLASGKQLHLCSHHAAYAPSGSVTVPLSPELGTADLPSPAYVKYTEIPSAEWLTATGTEYDA